MEPGTGTGSGAFASLMASVDPAMVVVTTAVDGERGGCLVGFHTQSSIDPPRYAVWLSKANHTYRLALRAEHLAVHLVDAEQRQLAERFGSRSGDQGDKFTGLAVTDGPGGVPLLDDVPHRFVGRRVALLDEGGDHVCLTLDPVRAEADGELRPLRLSAADDIAPGHDAEERHGPPTERAG